MAKATKMALMTRTCVLALRSMHDSLELLFMPFYVMKRIPGRHIRQSQRSNIAIHSVPMFRSESIGPSMFFFLNPSIAGR